MGNPITDLWHVATGEWDRIAAAYGNTWRDMYDVLDFYKWKAEVQQAFYYLGQAVEYAAVLNATSDADTVEIGRDTAVNLRAAVRFLRWPLIPHYALLAYRDAVNWARASDLRLDAALTHRIALEHAAMLRRVLLEEMARQVAVAAEHADMLTRVAQEANARHLADLQLDSVLTARIATAKAQVLQALAAAVQQLTGQIAQVRAFAQSIPGLEDQRAANGYDPTLKSRASGIMRLLDTAVAHDPLVAALVKDLATWLVDLAEVEDPLIRLAAQFALKQVIDRLGLDTALGRLVSGLLGGILGGGPPKTLLDVTRDTGNRLNAAESGLADLSPLAPEADALAEMGTLAFDSALLGYLAAAVADPAAAADDTAAALDAVTGPLLGPVRSLLGMG